MYGVGHSLWSAIQLPAQAVKIRIEIFFVNPLANES